MLTAASGAGASQQSFEEVAEFGKNFHVRYQGEGIDGEGLLLAPVEMSEGD